MTTESMLAVVRQKILLPLSTAAQTDEKDDRNLMFDRSQKRAFGGNSSFFGALLSHEEFCELFTKIGLWTSYDVINELREYSLDVTQPSEMRARVVHLLGALEEAWYDTSPDDPKDQFDVTVYHRVLRRVYYAAFAVSLQ